MKNRSEIVAAVDFGTTKISVLVAQIDETGMTVLGVGTAECEEGLRKGMVIAIGKVVEAIRQARHDAEQMSGCIVSDILVGVGGTHIVGVNNQAMVSPKSREINEMDVSRVLEMARALSMPVDRQVITVLPKQYAVDEHDGIKDPVGMAGVRLDAEVHLVTAARSALDNLRRCCERSGLHVVQFVANPVASALAVLEDHEKEFGVVVLDLGGGTGDLTIWHGGRLVHTGVIGVGAELITRDIATGLRMPMSRAEELKVKFGCAWGELVGAGEQIEVPGVGGREDKPMSRRVLTEIIEPRVIEIYSLVKREIQKTQYDDNLAGGLVLTGGASRMPGMVELGDEILNLPVRLGQPRGIQGLKSILESPGLASVYGLAVFASLSWRPDLPKSMLPVTDMQPSGGIRGFLKRIGW
jgi:cell division protein FtsA